VSSSFVEPGAEGDVAAGDARELVVRHARKDGRSVAILRAFEHGDSCAVEAEIFPQRAGAGALKKGPYEFADSDAAMAFVTEAADALMYLGCDVQAQ
jgi:hypothetical protein